MYSFRFMTTKKWYLICFHLRSRAFLIFDTKVVQEAEISSYAKIPSIMVLYFNKVYFIFNVNFHIFIKKYGDTYVYLIRLHCNIISYVNVLMILTTRKHMCSRKKPKVVSLKCQSKAETQNVW